MPEAADPDLYELYRRLRAAADAGHVALLALLCREYLAHDPRHWLTWHELGSALWPLARYTEAKRAFRHAAEHCPAKDLHFIYAEIGDLHKRRGKYLTAARWYQKVIVARPDDAGGYIFRGAVLAREGDLRGAEEMHRAATACRTGCIDEAYLNLGLVLRGQGRSGEAAECFRKALELTPDYPEAKDGLADVEQVLAHVDAV